MADLSDPDSLMPDEARMAEIRMAVADYNAGRPAIQRAHRIRYPAVMTAYVLFAGSILIILWVHKFEDALIFVGAGALFLLGYVNKFADETRHTYQLSLRRQLLPKVFGFIERFRFDHGHDFGVLKSLGASRLIGFGQSEARDYLAGEHGGIAFELVEAELETGGKNSSVVFEGLVLKFHRPARFAGTLQARRKLGGFDAVVRELFGFANDIYECGDPAIDATHEFFTDNPVAARKLMFEPLAKAIDYLQDNWPDGRVLVGFQEDQVFLLLPTKRDLFELPDIGTDVDFAGTIMPMLRDMVMLLATMDLVAKVGQTGQAGD